jgi:hypothetical protein
MVGATLVTIALASLMHLDWHFARPVHHQLSLGLSQHWLLAIPVFALLAWYVSRVWSVRPFFAGIVIIGIAAFLAQVAEPLEEMFVGDATLEWAFGAPRLIAFAAFTGVGIVVFSATLMVLRQAHATSRVNR